MGRPGSMEPPQRTPKCELESGNAPPKNLTRLTCLRSAETRVPTWLAEMMPAWNETRKYRTVHSSKQGRPRCARQATPATPRTERNSSKSDERLKVGKTSACGRSWARALPSGTRVELDITGIDDKPQFSHSWELVPAKSGCERCQSAREVPRGRRVSRVAPRWNPQQVD